MNETSDERLDADRQTCQYIVHWYEGGAPPLFCGTAATKRYPAMGGGFMLLCDEHSIKHLDYAEDVPRAD